MLTCPPSRISLTASDLASFEQRWAARQSARQDTENVRLGQGASRPTRLAFVPAASNVGRHHAEWCSSKATICTTEDDDPTIHSNAASPAQRLELPSLVSRNDSPPSTTTRHERPSPQTQKTGQPAPTQSPSRPVSPEDFIIYEDPPIVQAFIESRHFQQPRNHGIRELDRIRPATPDLQHTRAQPARNPRQVPTINQPLLYPTLDPGAPVFVPRTRFGSTASTSADNHIGGAQIDSYAAPVARDQSTANLRVRSSFERNTQHSSHGTERQSVISDSSLSLVPTDAPQNRRRSRNNDQNVVLQRPLLGLDRYPAIRPPSLAFASRRSSGSQRQVVFPHRRSSRQRLIEFERSRRTQETRQQNRLTHLAVPRNNGLRPVSPAVSTSSRSTPNLLHLPTAPHSPARSSSLSLGQADSQIIEELPTARRPRRTAPVSESSSLIEEVFLQRDSPLDRLVQKYTRHPTRPRSVGHSFERPPGRQTRPSLLNGDPFREDPSDDLQDDVDWVDGEDIRARLLLRQVQRGAAPEPSTTVSPTSKPVARTPHKREPTIEDPVALALALPSPEVPSSHIVRYSPVLQPSPPLPSTPLPRPSPSSPLSPTALTSSAAKSPHSAASLTPSTQSLAAAVTPRVLVYNDNRPTAQQPQTPADITRSSRRTRGRSNTTSAHQSALATVQPSPIQPGTERRPHRHTFPSTTPQPTQEVRVGMTPVQTTAVVEPASAMRRDSLMVRLEPRSSDSSENEIEGNLDGLEQDRRVWIRRREGGSLDVTPPREGRFERYLS